MNIAIRWIAGLIAFIFILFVTEFILTVSISWALVNVASIDGRWISNFGILPFSFFQVIVRYVFLCPLMIYLVFRYVGNTIYQKAFFILLVFLLNLVVLFLFDNHIFEIMMLEIGRAAGISVWIEIFVTSVLLAFVWKRYIYGQISNRD